jgi:polyhydroxyalkanoate synthesis regulator phasin
MKEEIKMEPKQIAKQMVDFNKKAFDASFEAMAAMQEQTEKMVSTMMQQSQFFPDEGKKLITDWLKTYKKGREEFKAAADENFKKVDAFFSAK